MEPMKVLVVEDDLYNLELLCTRLSHLDCETLVARTAAAGLELARTDRPALILLDLRLGSDLAGGLDLLTQLREDPQTEHIPVFIHSIFVANRGDLPSAERMASGYLLKPFKFEDLRRIVEAFRVPA